MGLRSVTNKQGSSSSRSPKHLFNQIAQRILRLSSFYCGKAYKTPELSNSFDSISIVKNVCLCLKKCPIHFYMVFHQKPPFNSYLFLLNCYWLTSLGEEKASLLIAENRPFA